VCAAGCDDDTSTGGGRDLSGAAMELSAPTGADLSTPCRAGQMFGGFTDPNGRLDCSCGCVIDSFTGLSLGGFWAFPSTGGSTFNPTPSGLPLTVVVANGGAAETASLSSLSPTAPFFLDGDFDLLVDYHLPAPLPADAHLVLGVQPIGASYTVERGRSAAGQDQLVAYFGVPPVTKPTAGLDGNLELKRSGTTVQALADGYLISQFTGASNGRTSMTLAAALASCVTDGGSCTLNVVWRNLRMQSGALVGSR
jgi:hypothetical protein